MIPHTSSSRLPQRVSGIMVIMLAMMLINVFVIIMVLNLMIPLTSSSRLPRWVSGIMVIMLAMMLIMCL